MRTLLLQFVLCSCWLLLNYSDCTFAIEVVVEETRFAAAAIANDDNFEDVVVLFFVGIHYY